MIERDNEARAITAAYGAAAAVFLVLLLAAWQFSLLERSLTRQIALGNAAYAQQERLLQMAAEKPAVRSFLEQREPQILRAYKKLRTEQLQTVAEARAQRARTIALTRFGYGVSLALLAAIGIWIAAFAFTIRRAKFHRAASLKDALTGLTNRTGAIRNLQTLTAHGESFGVVFLDLDGFKKINDTHGHARGDTLLQDVASRLTGEVRGGDFVARLGGDEFVCIIAPPTSAQHLRSIAERLERAVTRPYSAGDDSFIIGCSAGYSLFPDDGLEAQALLDRADRAMYTAKAAGGGVQSATQLRKAYLDA
jgi:diguanylate cyclase (GGDEF)-like protein